MLIVHFVVEKFAGPGRQVSGCSYHCSFCVRCSSILAQRHSPFNIEKALTDRLGDGSPAMSRVPALTNGAPRCEAVDGRSRLHPTDDSLHRASSAQARRWRSFRDDCDVRHPMVHLRPDSRCHCTGTASSLPQPWCFAAYVGMQRPYRDTSLGDVG